MERWQQIESLFQEALNRPAAERDGWLRQACKGDSGLRREVESLLTNHRDATPSEPWPAAAAAQLLGAPESLEPGQSLGPYRIVSFIASGGMGAVYRAHDPRTGRDVAVKVAGQRFNERFSREVRAVAALNHPNICTLFDVGPNYLVMELVEGESPKGPLPVETALNYAKQIADALEAAHEKGIVHRDLKPGNIKIKPDGSVKVLDFGLAQVGGTPAIQSNDSPTITMEPTRAGVILGTAAYMSPEQARGKQVDKRADIWAFGVVLYEMLTGRQLFQGETVSDTLASVLTKEPDWDRIPLKTQRLVKSCLEKDPSRRLRDIGDAARLLDETPSTKVRRSLLAWAVAGLLLVTTLMLALVHFREKSPLSEPVRFEVAIPAKEQVLDLTPTFAVSPDGRRLVFFAAGSDGKIRIWLRELSSLEARPLQGTETEFFATPFWSPNSRYVGFSAGGKLKKIDVSNGLIQTVADVPVTPGLCGSWSEGDVIIFSSYGSKGIASVAAAGGPISFLTASQALSVEGSHWLPRFLPDGKHFLYIRYSSVAENSGVYLGSVHAAPEQQPSKRLFAADINYNFGLEYVLSKNSQVGQVLFESEGTLLSQSFDENRLVLAGEPVPVGVIGKAYFSSSANGVLVYRTRNSALSRPGWLDRSGRVLESLGESGDYLSLALSPDGTRAALTRFDVTSGIWILDLIRSRMTRVTFDPDGAFRALWSPDAGRIVFEQGFNLRLKASNGTGDEQLLVKSDGLIEPNDWSRDLHYLLYQTASAKGKSQLWILPMIGDRKAFRFAEGDSNQFTGRFSPDGRLVAYASDESGRSEIYVQPFNPPSGLTPARVSEKWPVSKAGGLLPHWRSDGKELIYQADRKIMAVDVTTNPVFVAGEPKTLFDLGNAPLWDVTGDGQKFLVTTLISENTQAPFSVVLNWPALIKK